MLTAHHGNYPVNWVESLPSMLHAYMRREHTGLDKVCPFQMLYGFLPKLPVAVRDAMLVASHTDVFAPAQYVLDLQDRVERQNAQQALYLDRRMRQRALDDLYRKRKRRATNEDLKVGDKVMEVTAAAQPLCSPYKGPFLIVALDPSKTHAILQTGETQFRKAQCFKRHTSHLVKYNE